MDRSTDMLHYNELFASFSPLQRFLRFFTIVRPLLLVLAHSPFTDTCQNPSASMTYPCGQPGCGAMFLRAWNLKRHLLVVHRLTSTQFVNTTLSIPMTPRSEPATDSGQFATKRTTEPFVGLRRSIEPYSDNISSDDDLSTIFERNSQASGESLFVPQEDDVRGVAIDRALDDQPYFTSSVRSSSSGSSRNEESADTEDRTSRKRKRSIPNDRILRAHLCQKMPNYEVKQSQRVPGQQKAIDWLSRKARQEFQQVFRAFVARWGGVEPTHQGTCVLCPEDWRSLTPTSLVENNILDPYRLPGRHSPRLMYQYSDHITTFTRAVAWFGGKCPRSGIYLDNFLGCGPYKPMEASHLCHQEHCLLHVVYEPADINQDRKSCAAEARFARQSGEAIQKSCSRHDPPCLLQVSYNSHLQSRMRLTVISMQLLQ